MKTLRYALEAAALSLAFLIFRLMPVVCASAIGGALARSIGPRLAVSRKARRNIENALNPGPDEVEEIIRAMWDNLGRTFAEYPHLKTIAQPEYTEIVGMTHLQQAIDHGGILFSGHLSNWEINGPSYVTQIGEPVSLVYRAPNNPVSDWLLNICRVINSNIHLIPKSRSGARQMMDDARNAKTIGILIDQKYNEGIAVPFFGKPAMTSPAFVQLAQKYNRPLLPIQMERIDGPRFRITVHKPVPVEGRAVEDVILDAHHLMEGWIRKRPGQWLWLHRRWVED